MSSWKSKHQVQVTPSWRAAIFRVQLKEKGGGREEKSPQETSGVGGRNKDLDQGEHNGHVSTSFRYSSDSHKIKCLYLLTNMHRYINKLETTAKNCSETCPGYRKQSQERGGKQVIFIIGLFGENLIKKNREYSHPDFPSIYL